MLGRQHSSLYLLHFPDTHCQTGQCTASGITLFLTVKTWKNKGNPVSCRLLYPACSEGQENAQAWLLSLSGLAPGRCQKIFPCCRIWWEWRVLTFLQNLSVRDILTFSMCTHLRTTTWMSFPVFSQFCLSHLLYLQVPSSAFLMSHTLFLTIGAEHWNSRAKWNVCREKGKEKQFFTHPPICDRYISVNM